MTIEASAVVMATGSRIGVRDDMNEVVWTCAFSFETDAKSPMLLDTAFLRYDDWSERYGHGYWVPHFCGMTIRALWGLAF